MCACVCVCVCACVRACVRACERACVRACVGVRERDRQTEGEAETHRLMERENRVEGWGLFKKIFFLKSRTVSLVHLAKTEL